MLTGPSRIEDSAVRRAVISNVYADDNRGGSAITAATIEAVRRAFPGCAVSLITTTDSADDLSTTHRHTMRSFPDVEVLPAILAAPKGPLAGIRAVLRSLLLLAAPRSPRRNLSLQRVRQADLVIGKGGQVFSLRRGIRGVAGLWLVLFPVILAARLGITRCLYSVTVGPYGTRDMSRALAGWILRRMNLVLVRDARSRSEVLRLGVKPGAVVQIPDCVFSLVRDTRSRVESLLEEYGLERRRFCTVTITRPAPNEEPPIFEYIGGILEPLLDRGAVDRVLIVVQADGKVKSDLKPSEDLLRHLSDSRVAIVREDLSVEDLMTLYEASAFTLGGRIHSAILSLVAGTPGFPLLRTGAIKAESIFGTIGLGRWVARVDLPASHWVELIDRVASNGETRAEIVELVGGLRDECRRISTSALRAVVGENRKTVAS